MLHKMEITRLHTRRWSKEHNSIRKYNFVAELRQGHVAYLYKYKHRTRRTITRPEEPNQPILFWKEFFNKNYIINGGGNPFFLCKIEFVLIPEGIVANPKGIVAEQLRNKHLKCLYSIRVGLSTHWHNETSSKEKVFVLGLGWLMAAEKK